MTKKFTTTVEVTSVDLSSPSIERDYRVGKWWGWEDFVPRPLVSRISDPLSEEANAPSDVHRISIDAEKLRSLIADLTAAEWVESRPDEVTPNSLVESFLLLHDQLLGIIKRHRPNIFQSLDEDTLYELARRWCILYRATLSEHRRIDVEANEISRVVLDNRDWGRALNLGRDAILTVEYPARFAEFWAERSVRSKAVFESFEERLNHVGTRRYHLIHKLTCTEELLVLDQYSNGVPSYDIFLSLENHNSTGDIAKSLELDGWNVVILTAKARKLLYEEAYVQAKI